MKSFKITFTIIRRGLKSFSTCYRQFDNIAEMKDYCNYQVKQLAASTYQFNVISTENYLANYETGF